MTTVNKKNELSLFMLNPAGSMNRSGWIAEISMTLPKLNRSRHDSEIQQALEELTAIQLESRKQQATIAREVRDAEVRVKSARTLIDLYRATVAPDIQTVSKAVTVAYQTNQAGLLQILESQGMSIEAEYALFDALSEYERGLAELESAIGVPLPGERSPL